MNDGIFVSYSHRDSAAVEKIVSTLNTVTGMEVWFDHKLRGGENYFSVIANQIIKNKYFVFVVSDNSIESDWCLRELEFAASEKKYIIAIWLNNVSISPRIKLVIQNTHYINWYSTTDEIFSQAVSLAFRNNSDGPSKLGPRRDRDEIIPQSQKYFLCKEEMNKLEGLLRAEKDEKYSVCFTPENARLLGIAYEVGIFTDPDPKKASLYYKAAKYAGDADGKYLYAALMYAKNPEANKEYLTEMLEAADSGGILAMTRIAEDYYYGENGLPADINKSYEYFEKAAKNNGVAAMYSTAYGYNNGENKNQDYEIAYMYALRAKEHGFPRAYRLLAYMYESGKYLEKNPDKALELYDQAIELGDFLSLCYKGKLCGDLGDIEKKTELYMKAVEYAEEGKIRSATPYYRLAVIYDDGIGVEQDREKAIEYYFKAAAKNHKLAKKWAVPCILNLGGPKKQEYLQKAFELNCNDAAYELGNIEKAKNTNSKERLSDAAVRYYEAGAESGDMCCVISLIGDFSYVVGNGRYGKNASEDRSHAIKWFRFFFANADEDFLNKFRNQNILATYYYAYAIELDYDPEGKMPDREFVLYNFKKSIEECPKHLGHIAGFAIDGYLFPNEAKSGLDVDVAHAEDILSLVQENLNGYFNYLKENTPDTCSKETEKTNALLKKAYTFISKCYKNGTHVQKNKEKSEKYKQMAEKIR